MGLPGDGPGLTWTCDWWDGDCNSYSNADILDVAKASGLNGLDGAGPLLGLVGRGHTARRSSQAQDVGSTRRSSNIHDMALGPSRLLRRPRCTPICAGAERLRAYRQAPGEMARIWTTPRRVFYPYWSATLPGDAAGSTQRAHEKERKKWIWPGEESSLWLEWQNCACQQDDVPLRRRSALAGCS